MSNTSMKESQKNEGDKNNGLMLWTRLKNLRNISVSYIDRIRRRTSASSRWSATCRRLRPSLRHPTSVPRRRPPVADWYNVFQSELIAEACLDRLVHKSKRFELKGESLRKKY